jgi:hypothetical protein
MTAEEQAAADALLLEEEGMGFGTIALIGLAGIAAVGGGYWYYTSEPTAAGEAGMAGAEAGGIAPEGEGMSTTMMIALGLGGLAALGGIYWYATAESVDETAVV